jgi:predicted nicotinamide N-methyase
MNRKNRFEFPMPPPLIAVHGHSVPDETPADRRQWFRLWWRMSQRFELRRTAVKLGQEQSFPWTEVMRPDQVLERSVESNALSVAEADPFWASLWRAYQGLVLHLQSLGVQGKRILEVGCGQGAMGIAAAMMGAEVTLSDSVGNALLVAQIHAWPVRHLTRVRRLRWGVDRFPGEQFDIIAGSDVLYEPLAWDALLETAREHLAPDGLVLFSEPPRYTGEKFAGWMATKGWNVEIVWIDLKDRNPLIRIFVCQPRI